MEERVLVSDIGDWMRRVRESLEPNAQPGWVYDFDAILTDCAAALSHMAGDGVEVSPDGRITAIGKENIARAERTDWRQLCRRVHLTRIERRHMRRETPVERPRQILRRGPDGKPQPFIPPQSP